MQKKRYTKSEIQKILQEYKKGSSIPQIIENYGISQATFYNWRAKYVRPLSSDVAKFHELEEDHDRLKGMFADLSIENQSLKTRLKNLEDKLKQCEQY
ncbi:MAG: transposase [Prolixibacteraceae bacterium]|nr:transposase [Prolixibacteraceae bacterium]